MNKDQVKGRIEEAKGKVKEVAGKVVGNKDLEQEGKIQSLYEKYKFKGTHLCGALFISLREQFF